MQKWLRPVSFVLIAALGVGTFFALQQQEQAGSEQATSDLPDPVATVGGEPITRAELEALTAPAEAQLDAQRYEMQRQAVDQLVAERLLTTEATAKGVTVQELVEQQIMAGAQQPTDEQIRAFFDEHAEEMGGAPFEVVGPQIAQHLAQEGAEERARAYLDELKARTPVDIRIDAPRFEVATEGQPRRGPADAPVTVVEFSDFQCPYCADAATTLGEVAAKYGDDVAIVFRNYPLQSHADARPAAEAGECALDQGRFWELHDAMFAAPADLGREQLVAHAGTAGLDVDKFTACLDGGAKAAEVAADLAAGEKVGVQGTPAVLVNGRMIGGEVSVESVSRMVDEALADRPAS